MMAVPSGGWSFGRPARTQAFCSLAPTGSVKPPSSVIRLLAASGSFLRVNDFDAAYEQMTAAGVRFVTASRTESYGRVAVFLDIAGNRWDLLGPA